MDDFLMDFNQRACASVAIRLGLTVMQGRPLIFVFLFRLLCRIIISLFHHCLASESILVWQSGVLA
jgi:hypothetical protein